MTQLKLFLAALILALTSLSVAPAFAGETQIKVSAKNFAFTPSTITLKVHQRTRLIFVSNQGMHGITIPEIGVKNVVNIGKKPSMVEVTPARTGTFVARCAVYCGLGHGNMLLTVKVVK